MPLTLEELQDIQADNLADDIEIDFAKMSLWTKEQAVAFFETGEEPPPPFEPEPYLMGRLARANYGNGVTVAAFRRGVAGPAEPRAPRRRLRRRWPRRARLRRRAEIGASRARTSRARAS